MKRLAGLALFLAVLGSAAIVRARHDAVIPYPADEVSTALARLSQPSIPRPLPGDPAIAVGWYGHAGTCDDARAAYQAAAAPLPVGSTATVDASGNVQVAAPHGAAGIVFADTADGACDYAAQLRANAEGRIRTWAVQWYASVFLHGGETIHLGIEGLGEQTQKTVAYAG